MKNLLSYFRRHRDTALLSGALLLLIATLFRPSILIKHNIYSYLMIADISQSMNAIDMSINGKPATRIAHTQKIMSETISSLPCGTKVGIGLFAGNSIAALYTPIEVCANFSAIQDTIDHLDWRTGWSGNSRIRHSLFSTAQVIRNFPEPAQVVLITDGEEAPKLHAFNTKDLTNFQGADGWLLVGVGTEKGVAIPKLSDKNQVIGYWSNDSFALQPGIAQVSESTLGVRNDDVAGEYDRFISKHNPEYLKSVAKEIGATYIYGDSTPTLLKAMQKQSPARHGIAPFDLSWILASIAGLFLLAAYFSKHPFRQMGETMHFYKKSFQRTRSQNEAAIAHDNHF